MGVAEVIGALEGVDDEALEVALAESLFLPP